MGNSCSSDDDIRHWSTEKRRTSIGCWANELVDRSDYKYRWARSKEVKPICPECVIDSGPDRGQSLVFESDSWKCNLFIADVLYMLQIDPPRTSYNWPIPAGYWHSRCVFGWSDIDDDDEMQTEDIVATPKHVGIVYQHPLDREFYNIAAGEHRLYRGRDIITSPHSIKRWDGHTNVMS